MTASINGETFLNLRESAAYLDVSPERMRTLLREERIPGAEKGLDSEDPRAWMCPQGGLDEYLDSKGGGGGGGRTTGLSRKVTGLTEETIQELQAWVDSHPGTALAKAYYQASPAVAKKRREAEKAKVAATRERLAEAGIIPPGA